MIIVNIFRGFFVEYSYLTLGLLVLLFIAILSIFRR